MQLANLFARIGIKADNQQANTFLKSVKNIKVGMVAAAAGATVLTLKLRQITDEAFQTTRALKQINAETGINTDELQKWQAVADQTSNAAGSVTASIKSIVANQEKIKLGGGDISGFQLLGIDPQQDPFKILEELRTKTKGLSDGMKKNVLAQVGVGAELIETLQLSNAEFERMAGQAFIIPKSAIDTIDKARASTRTLSQGFKFLRTMIAAQLSPSIERNSKILSKWIKQNEQKLLKVIKQITKWVGRFVKAGIDASRMIDDLVRNTIGWDKALVGIIGLITLLNLKLLASPMGLFIAGIVLLVAVLEDLYAFSQGKKSLFGELLNGDIVDRISEKWKVFGEVLRGIADAMKGIRDFVDPEASTPEEKRKRFSRQMAIPEAKLKEMEEKPLFGGFFQKFFGKNKGDTTNNYNINQNINATGDPQSNADMIDKKIQDTINSANSQIGGDE
jgi:hypothetical protein